MNVFLRGIDPEMPVKVHASPAVTHGLTANSNGNGFGAVKQAGLPGGGFEDFRPWERYPAIDAFYELIEWLNSPESVFAADGCKLAPPADNLYDMPAGLVLEGRFILFFRDTKLDLADVVDESRYEVNQNMTGLATRCHEFGYPLYADAWRNAVELFFIPCIYVESKETAFFGQKLSFDFLCYGDDEKSLFDGLMLVTVSLLAALKQANEEWKVAHQQGG
ncbi:MAG: hypothetical protein ABIV21_04745 [Pyrinomonadaceae bacterium]